MRKDERGHRGPERVVAARCCTSGKALGLEQIAMGFPIDRSELKSIKSTLIRKKIRITNISIGKEKFPHLS